MKATSTTPPAGLGDAGRPVAKGVTSPVFTSTREICPICDSATYNAPSGPITLPRALCRPATSRWGVAGARSKRSVLALGGESAVVDGAVGRSEHPSRIAVPKAMQIRLTPRETRGATPGRNVARFVIKGSWRNAEVTGRVQHNRGAERRSAPSAGIDQNDGGQQLDGAALVMRRAAGAHGHARARRLE